MKKILALLLIAVLSFSVLASCGKNTGGKDTTKPVTTGGSDTTDKQETTVPTGETTVPTGETTVPTGETTVPTGETTVPTGETTVPTGETTVPTGETTVEPGDEYDTDEAETIAFQYPVEGNKNSAFTSRRTGDIDLKFIIDGAVYGELAMEYTLYEYVVDIIDSKGVVTRINLGYECYFEPNEEEGIVVVYLCPETAEGFIPTYGENYTIKLYVIDIDEVIYYGEVDVTANLGKDPDDPEHIIREVPYLPWRYYAAGKPFENHHADVHENRLTYVIILEVPDPSMFSAANILSFFDLVMYVDGEALTIEEISGWNTGETSVGLRIGVEAAGFVPEEKGQVNKISFKLFMKDTEELLFEIEETNCVSNFPFGITRDPNRREKLEDMYSFDKITFVSGPAGFNAAEGPASMFDGDMNTKWCTPDCATEPVVFTTAEAIKVASFSLLTANDNAQYGGRVPTGFKLEGSTDGVNWETLANIQNYTFDPLEDHREYNFPTTENKTKAYDQFRITFTGSGTVQFSDIEIYPGK